MLYSDEGYSVLVESHDTLYSEILLCVGFRIYLQVIGSVIITNISVSQA